MATPCFYHPDLSVSDQHIELSQAESLHAMQSRRLTSGAAINLINGQGLRASAVIVEPSKRKVTAEIQQLEVCEPALMALSVAVALPKGDRQKVMVDMLTQLGVHQIIPLTCEYSVSTLKSSQVDKLQRVAIEACKQAQNPWLPTVCEPVRLSDFCLSDQVKNSVQIFAHQYGKSAISVKHDIASAKQAVVFIGPEGGFSDSEQAVFEAQGALSVSLGQHILRTEAAAVAVASLFLC